MFETIWWRCHVHAADRRGAERVVSRLGTQLMRAVEIDSYERYWKFPELAVMQLVSPLQRSTPETALLTALECAWRIATPWSLSAAGSSNEYEGIASANVGSRFTVPGVEWMEFRINGRP
ncbi:hypothetical protein [Streptomyces ardesiacus]|uniref:hypothetical protein n=1 Tax=Streptomyces ardesiacus TaxID=285564 RepID=UPI000A3DE764|nr:hypothetical protein [Streptomyces sp. NBRC 110030]